MGPTRSRSVWLVVSAALLLAAAGAVVVVKLATGPASQVSIPGSLPPARIARPALMLAGHERDVLVGLTIRQGGPIDVTAIPADLGPLAGSAVSVSIGGRAESRPVDCGRNCSRVPAPAALRHRLRLSVTVTRHGARPVQVGFQLPARMPPSAAATLTSVNRRMAAVRSFQLDEAVTTGRSGVRARFLFRAPDRMSYVIAGGGKAVVIGARRWDTQGSGPWQESSSPGVRVPSYVWAGAGSARLIGRATVAAQPVTVLAAFRPDADFPAWYRLFVRGDRRVVRVEMTAPAHFMVDRLSRFDAAISIVPPR